MSVCSCPVNIQANPTLGVLSHMAIQAPMPSPVVNVSVEMLTFQFWIYGYVTNKNKFGKKTKHRGQWIVQNGHDCGMMIPDVTFPIFPNLLYTIHWPFSKRAITFGASTVKVEGQPAACAAIVPPFPMMTCGQPVSAPTSFSYMANLNNVFVGMTAMDIFAGCLKIALSIAIDLIFNKLGKMLKGPADDVAERSTSQILRQVALPALGEKLGSLEAAKSVATGLAGLATSSLTGDPTFKASYGLGDIVGAEFSLSYDRSKGDVEPSLQGHALGAQADTSGNRSRWGEQTATAEDGGG